MLLYAYLSFYEGVRVRFTKRPPRSKIWDKKLLEQALVGAKSISDVLRRFGYQPAGGNHRTVKAACAAFGLCLPDGREASREASLRWHKSNFSLDKILVRGSTYSRRSLKRRLISAGLLKEECAICKLGPSWNGRPLALHLDHINGINNDDRLDNVRLLCPNCHSQTPTYCGRQKRLKVNTRPADGRRPKYEQKTKIDWPARDALQVLVLTTPVTVLAHRLSVSDAAIRKRCRKLALVTRPRGYWRKIETGFIGA